MQRIGSSLLLSKRFGPLFLVQFFGAFNDNICKTAMLFLVTFKLAGTDGFDPASFGSLAAGLFVLPFFLFSALAGRLADHYDKTKVTRILKAVEVVTMLLGTAAITLESIPFMLVVLFLIGSQSAFFGPIKYAILPQHIDAKELLSATGYVEAGTFIAILLGQVVGGVISPEAAGVIMLVGSVLGVVASYLMPAAPPLEKAEGAQQFSLIPFSDSARILSSAARNRTLWHAILGISWFWGVGALMTAQLVVLVEVEIRSEPFVATLFLIIFSIGISIGSMLSNVILKAEVTSRIAPQFLVAMSISMIVFLLAVAAVPEATTEGGTLETLAYLTTLPGIIAVLGLFSMALSGGLFVVPLYAILQTSGPPASRSRDIAANNIVNAGAMVAVAGLSAALLGFGIPVLAVLFGLAALNCLAAALSFRLA